jgi:hypothetical protein
VLGIELPADAYVFSRSPNGGNPLIPDSRDATVRPHGAQTEDQDDVAQAPPLLGH